MTQSRGPKRAAYQKEYNARPEEIKKRAQRNAARREYEKKNGDLPTTVEVDHKTPVRKGGGNDGENLRAVDAKKNRAWRKGKKNYD